MWGLLRGLRRTADPQPIIGYLFRVRADYTPKTGIEMMVAVQELHEVKARELAIDYPDVAEGVEVSIETMRPDDIRDFPLPDAYLQQVGRVRHFGAAHHHHFHRQWWR